MIYCVCQNSLCLCLNQPQHYRALFMLQYVVHCLHNTAFQKPVLVQNCFLDANWFHFSLAKVITLVYQ